MQLLFLLFFPERIISSSTSEAEVDALISNVLRCAPDRSGAENGQNQHASPTVPAWACEKVASDLGLGSAFRRVLRFSPLLTTG